jgi:hypothetical protein
MDSVRQAVLRFLCVAILATGCSSMTARTTNDYERGNVPEARFQKDAEACDKQAVAHQKEFGYGPYDLLRGPYNRMYDMCMRSSGYQLKPQSQQP